MEPAYSFTIPSIEDDTKLDCRLYQPEDFGQLTSSARPQKFRGAVIAHPYAPLGGCYDDPVVLNLTHTLLTAGWLVVTFNFRGAGDSRGSTSWSGKPEQDDYISVVGFMLHHLWSLSLSDLDHSNGDLESSAALPSTDLLLGGYSYGSLILTKLPPLQAIVKKFESAAIGTSAAEIVLRARRLAAETVRAAHELESKHERGRTASSLATTTSTPSRSRAHSLTVTVGGEETDVSQRCLNPRDSRRPADLVRKSVEIPHRIKMHLKRRNSSISGDESTKSSQELPEEPSKQNIRLRYLLVSPLLPPLAHALVPPTHVTHIFGHHSDARNPDAGFGTLEHPILVIYGGQDGFTSAKKLDAWAEKLEAAAQGVVKSASIRAAGHFWREQGTMRELLHNVTIWLNATDV